MINKIKLKKELNTYNSYLLNHEIRNSWLWSDECYFFMFKKWLLSHFCIVNVLITFYNFKSSIIITIYFNK